jgi:hypothetical protein
MEPRPTLRKPILIFSLARAIRREGEKMEQAAQYRYSRLMPGQWLEGWCLAKELQSAIERPRGLQIASAKFEKRPPFNGAN